VDFKLGQKPRCLGHYPELEPAHCTPRKSDIVAGDARLVEGAQSLLSRFETALRASARLLHDLVRVYRAAQVRDAFDARACGSLRRNACGRRRGGNFVGFASGQGSFARAELELAAARGDIDIAYAADDGIRIDGNFRVGREAEAGVAAEQARE
jgi:hypothetical protein